MLKIELEMSYVLTGQLTKARLLDQIELIKKKIMSMEKHYSG